MMGTVLSWLKVNTLKKCRLTGHFRVRGGCSVTKEMFDQVMIFVEGAYNQKFPQEWLTAAWSLFSEMDNHLVGLGARRMVEESEESPSPIKWLRCVKAIQQEALEERRTRETKARLEVQRQLPAVTGAGLLPDLNVGANAPRYPGLGLRQILAVRALETAGMGHEEALREVRGRGKLAESVGEQ
jgi:hypothetical protein